jgi:diguanylate cyclase (GGDEF)-like protein/PAS domain S-box-containing protein
VRSLSDLWKVAAEASEDAVFGLGADGCVVTWTTAAARLFGAPGEAVLGRPCDGLFDDSAASYVARALDGEQFERLRVDARRSNGMTVPVALTMVPVADGEGVAVLVRDLTEQVSAQETLAESEHRLHEAQALSHVGLWIWDIASDALHLSDELYRIHGVHPAEFEGTMRAYLGLVHGDDRRSVQIDTEVPPGPGETLEREYRVVRPGGEVRWIYARAQSQFDEHGAVVALRGIGQDITERKRAAETLQKHASLLEVLRRMAMSANEASTVEEAAKACLPEVCRHTGWDVVAVHAVDDGRVSPRGLWFSAWPGRYDGLQDVIEQTPISSGGAVAAAVRDRRPAWRTGHLQAASAAGLPTVIAFPLVVDGDVVAVLRFFSDLVGEPDEQMIATVWDGTNQLGQVVDRRRSRDRLAHAALHDALTGLPNRDLLLDRLGTALSTRRRESSHVALILLDLDNFKLVNDSLGHEAGDRLLVTIARRLERVVRSADTVARFGGDEFIILCDGLPSEEAVVDFAERVLSTVAEPVALGRPDTADAVLTASAGIAIAAVGSTPSAIAPEALLRDADSAMYRAKDVRRGRYQIFDEAMHQRAMKRLSVAGELRAAIDDDQLRLVYQPQVDIATERVIGVEALVRWQHPTRGLLGPYEFIEVAEETQLIVPLGSWVIREAARQAAEWQAVLGETLKVCVNVSAKQLGRAELVDDIACSLQANGLSPSALCMEITESVLMADADFCLEALLGIKMLGVDLAIDDFGTGYSSLAYLRRYPIDVIKVDKGFVDGLEGDDARGQAVVAAVVHLAHALEVKAVAEGVETAEQLRVLRALGCDTAQGFYFARPLPAADITRMLLDARDPVRG